ncbi:MAG: asparaginase [Acidimicrobiia bacterium]|nr:asparaginase [Acidimicrobiia bacterium]
MIVGSIRSGLIEAVHPVAAAAVDATGRIIATNGEASGRSFFLRSALKPIQAAVTDANGAALGLEQLAVADASHSAFPIHVTLVEHMLLEVGLDAGHLRCPPDYPSSGDAEAIWVRRGRVERERVFHNCSGKHAAMLRACVARDWPLEYTAADHPLQRQVIALAEELMGAAMRPAGVDGCGVPTPRADAVGLARMFSRVAVDPGFARVRTATMRFASLLRDGDRPETQIARWFPAVVKGGAMGCIGIAWPEGGIGFAAKCWTGDGAAATVAILTLMSDLGILSGYPREQLAAVISPEVLGGGAPVGSLTVIER